MRGQMARGEIEAGEKGLESPHAREGGSQREIWEQEATYPSLLCRRESRL